MKKIPWLLIFLPVCASAAQSPFDGLYAGGQLGMVYGFFHHTSTSTVNGNLFYPQTPGFPTGIPLSTSDYSSNLGADAGLHLGYGHVFNRFYLGAEINGDFQTVHANGHSITSDPSNADTYANTTYSARLTNGYGVTLRPGYLITPTLMLYAKGGFQGSHFQASSTTLYNNVPGGPTIGTTASGSRQSAGWQAGFGLEKRAKNHFGFRIEDLFSGYQGISATTQQNFNDPTPPRHGDPPPPPATITNSTHIRPFTNTIMVGVDYYFG